MSEEIKEGTPTPGEKPAAKEDPSYIKFRLERARKKWEPEIFQKAKTQIADELGISPDEFDSLKEQLAKQRESVGETEKLTGKMKALEKAYEKERQEKASLLEKISAYQHDLNSRLVNESIANALDGVKVHNLSQVARLLRDSFIVEEGRILHVEGGEPTGKKIEDAVKEFLKSNPHFVAAPSPQGGAGSHGSNGNNGIKSEDIRRALLTAEGRRDGWGKLFGE